LKNILVTGGAGYIGSHMCKILSQNGYTPVSFDNLSVGHEKAVKWGPLIRGDLKDKNSIKKAFENYSISAVMHFAANALVGESTINPLKYYENNVTSTINLIQAMIEHKVKYFIFSSTCATYGTPNYTPIDENHPQKPINPYGQSKLMIEQILSDAQKANDLSFACLRYFNAAGADFQEETGEHHAIETHLIPLLVETALGIRPFLDVYGTNYPTNDGSAIRDYIHVLDLADAHLKALEYIFQNKKSICLNLGTGVGFSVLEIINAAKKLISPNFKINYAPRRDGDPAVLIANNNKAKELLNWSLKYSDLDTIIASALKWHKKLHNIS
jgi:UDP-glucose-4-epimerase GalE